MFKLEVGQACEKLYRSIEAEVALNANKHRVGYYSELEIYWHNAHLIPLHLFLGLTLDLEAIGDATASILDFFGTLVHDVLRDVKFLDGMRVLINVSFTLIRSQSHLHVPLSCHLL